MVLDQPVRLEGVRADLAAKTDVALGFVQLAGFCLAFFDFELVEARAKPLHRQLAVLVLAALILALHDDAARQVRDAHRGFHLVHVLAARSAGPEGVDAHIFGLHDNFDSIVNLGNDEHRGEGGMAARGLIERGNPDQAVHPAFGCEKSEGVLAFDADRGGFESRAFAGRQIHDGRAEPFAFRPAEIHAQQHFGPILRFHAAGAGLDGHDGVQAVVFTGKQRERLQLGDIGVGRGDFALDFSQ